MKSIIFFGLLMVMPVVGCAPIASAEQKNKSSNINVIDNRYKLSTFTDNTLVGKYGFKGVNNFTSHYIFSCNQQEYKISIKSITDNGGFKTSITNIESSSSEVRKHFLKRVNDELESVEVAGPIGLQCSLNEGAGKPMYLVINGGYLERDTYHYSFKNFKFLLLKESFKVK